MAPPTKKLEAALISGTYDVFRDEPDATSVNKVRKHVEQKLGLEDDFFATPEWKQKSKAIIKEYVEKALDGWVPETKDEPEQKNGAKRQSSEVESPEPKRRKAVSKTKRAVKDESDVSDLSEDEKKPKKKAAPAKRKSKAADSDASDFDEEDKKPRKKSAPTKRKSKKLDSDEESPVFKSSSSPERKRKRKVEDELDEKPKTTALGGMETDEDGVEKPGLESSDEEKTTAKRAAKAAAEDTKTTPKEEETQAVDEEEEYSDVIDEAPKPKRKKKEPKDSSSKPAKSKAKKAPTSTDNPDEAEIKKLQSQLSKCGVRKLWHMELKQYGDDARAKIRHLRKMLTDIGMDGRFSEAKAREIKEMRELLADAEAAQEMNELWGTSTEGRASRSKSTVKGKSMKESDGSDAEVAVGDDDDDEDDDEENTFVARRRRAQADLAFLGDDSDSD